jgi:hypothetical protein
MDNINITEILVAVVAIAGFLLGIAKVVVKFTANKKDDAVVESISDIFDPIKDAVDGDKDSEKE